MGGPDFIQSNDRLFLRNPAKHDVNQYDKSEGIKIYKGRTGRIIGAILSGLGKAKEIKLNDTESVYVNINSLAQFVIRNNDVKQIANASLQDRYVEQKKYQKSKGELTDRENETKNTIDKLIKEDTGNLYLNSILTQLSGPTRLTQLDAGFAENSEEIQDDRSQTSAEAEELTNKFEEELKILLDDGALKRFNPILKKAQREIEALKNSKIYTNEKLQTIITQLKEKVAQRKESLDLLYPEVDALAGLNARIDWIEMDIK